MNRDTKISYWILYFLGWILVSFGGIWMVQDPELGALGIPIFVGGILALFRACLSNANARIARLEERLEARSK